VSFEIDLGEEPEEAWSEDLDQLVFRGSWLLEEVVFFYRKSRTVILADLIENFEPEKLGRFYRWLVRLAGAAHPDGKTPLDLIPIKAIDVSTSRWPASTRQIL
jgi:hypothetical protein